MPDLIGKKRYYQFTAIDCASRWRYLEIYDDCGNNSAINFLNNFSASVMFNKSITYYLNVLIEHSLEVKKRKKKN